jgi:hypothetical protein
MKKKHLNIDWESLKDEYEDLLLLFDEQPKNDYVLKAEWVVQGEFDLTKAGSSFIQHIAYLYIVLKQSIEDEQYEVSTLIKLLIDAELKNFIKIKTSNSEIKKDVDKIIKSYVSGMEKLFKAEIEKEYN